MFAGNEPYPVVTDIPVFVGDRIAQLDERMSPIIGIEGIKQQLFEPLLIEIVQRLFILIAFRIHDFEAPRHDEPFALLDTPRQMQIDRHVTVDVVQPLPVRAVDVDSHLPGVPPVPDVLAGKRIGSAMEIDDYFLEPSLVVFLRQIEIPVRRVQHVVGPVREKSAEKTFNIHSGYQLCLSLRCELYAKVSPVGVPSLSTTSGRSGMIPPARTPSSHLMARL